MRRFFIRLIQIIALVVFPFILLIRGAVYLHVEHQFLPYPALAGGVVLTSLLLVIYLFFVQKRFGRRKSKKSSVKWRAWLAFLVVSSYCIYGLFFLSNENAKGEIVHKEFSYLHPILRIGVSTFIIVDRDLLITDGSRKYQDYNKMGLPSKNQSLHYLQSNGYAHAVDLRTNGRSDFRNNLLEYYFQLMGFRTLRHKGTDDHLHVSLVSHDMPNAK